MRKSRSNQIVVKKAKDFFDEKAKSKVRFISLYGYMGTVHFPYTAETLSEQEQESFLRENYESAFHVILDVFGNQVDKMKGSFVRVYLPRSEQREGLKGDHGDKRKRIRNRESVNCIYQENHSSSS